MPTDHVPANRVVRRDVTNFQDDEAISIEHELRLRRWAREFYVPADERSDAWHPVILSEMEQKDYEEALVRPLKPVRYVPLEPTLERRFDQPHALRGPFFLKAQLPRRTERLYANTSEDELYYF